MYLTKEEFLVLSARKMGIHCKRDIAEKFKLSETTVALCDNNLFKKYGIKANSTVEAKQKLVEVADLKKVEVVEADKIPYFEYENDVLVKKIKITKIDVLALLDYFQYVEDEKKEYELILDEDASNMYRILEIKDVETLEKMQLTKRGRIKMNIKENKNVLLIGVGGGGQNIVNYIFNKKISNLKTLSINSDEQALKSSKTKNLLLCKNPVSINFPNLSFLTKKLFRKKLHLGCGGDVEEAKEYTFACKRNIVKEIKKANEIILISCFGGGTGTGATPIIAKYAYELAIRSRVIIVNPFRFEGSKRSQKAQEGIAELKKYTQNIYELHNEDLVMDFDKKESLKKVFDCTNEKICKMVIDVLNKADN